MAAKASTSIADTTQPLDNTPKTIRIYCGSTLPTSKQPLFVVNGKTMGDSISTNFINSLNTDLIDKIEVLKDAKATAIYGVAGFYGVILITTRQKDFIPAKPACRPEEYKYDNYTL
jgi:TonB-dependent SusC/RagA subfamily outer membrane receptor